MRTWDQSKSKKRVLKDSNHTQKKNFTLISFCFNSRCLPQLCRRCQSYIHSRWRRSATARPPDVTSYPHEDFDVTFDDVIQDDIYEDIEEDRQLYRIPESDYDDSGVFEEDQHGMFFVVWCWIKKKGRCKIQLELAQMHSIVVS